MSKSTEGNIVFYYDSMTKLALMGIATNMNEFPIGTKGVGAYLTTGKTMYTTREQNLSQILV